MGRKKSKGKKKQGYKRAHRKEEEEEASDNGCRDSEQARALPSPKNDTASENGDNHSDSEKPAFFGKQSYNALVDPEYVTYLEQSRESTTDDTCGDKSHEMQLLDSLNALRLVPTRSSNQDAGNELRDEEAIAIAKGKERVAFEISHTVRLNSDTSAITEHGIRLKDLLSPLLPDIPTINLELQDLPGMRNESPKKKARKTLSEAEMVAKNISMFRGAAVNLVPTRRKGSKIKEFEAASAVDQAIAFGAMAGRKHEISKSSPKTQKTPPLFTSTSPTVTSNLQSRNNGPHFRSGLSTATENNAELDEGRNKIGVNLNENSPLEIRSNRNIASMAVAENTRVENNGAGHSSKTELDLTIARLGNLNINENSPSEARSETSLEGSLNNSDQITDNSAQGLLQENNNIISNNQSSTPTRRNSSVRKKVKNNNSNVKRTPK